MSEVAHLPKYHAADGRRRRARACAAPAPSITSYLLMRNGTLASPSDRSDRSVSLSRMSWLDRVSTDENEEKGVMNKVAVCEPQFWFISSPQVGNLRCRRRDASASFCLRSEGGSTNYNFPLWGFLVHFSSSLTRHARRRLFNNNLAYASNKRNYFATSFWVIRKEGRKERPKLSKYDFGRSLVN